MADKNPSKDAADKFAEISVAYEALYDEDKRKIYDRGGEEALQQNEARGGAQAHNPFDIFEAFGFGGMGGRRGREEEPRTANVEIPVRVSLKQLYLGEVLDVDYKRQVLCVEASQCEKKNNACQGNCHHDSLHSVINTYVLTTLSLFDRSWNLHENATIGPRICAASASS